VLPHDLQLGVQLQQLIFDGRYILGLKAQRTNENSRSYQRPVSEQEIRYKVKSAYYQAQAAAMSKSYLERNLYCGI
jgi:outer membrane protein TolC